MRRGNNGRKVLTLLRKKKSQKENTTGLNVHVVSANSPEDDTV